MLEPLPHLRRPGATRVPAPASEQRAALQRLQDAVDAGDGVRLAGDHLELLPSTRYPTTPPSRG